MVVLYSIPDPFHVYIRNHLLGTTSSAEANALSAIRAVCIGTWLNHSKHRPAGGQCTCHKSLIGPHRKGLEGPRLESRLGRYSGIMPPGRADPLVGAFGPNAWLVEEMYEQYRRDPSALSPSWREFFEDLPEEEPAQTNHVATEQTNGSTSALAARGSASDRSQGPAPEPVRVQEAEPETQPLRGAAARVVANMQASLSVPTATSVRRIPAKLLEANRGILNEYLSRAHGSKVSYTHLIAYAVVQALHAWPTLNASFVADLDGKGTPGVLRHPHVGLGIAVDLTRPDGSRTLVVPVIKQADTMGFREFVMAYEDLVRRARSGRLSADDLSGATVTITNPGTLGTDHSVPRLMAGQGVIIGVGAIDWPAELRFSDPSQLAELGVSKVVTLTSTYDHRIIQGAESGGFLGRIDALLQGADGFYDEIFGSLGISYSPVRAARDRHPADSVRDRLLKQTRVQALINMYRVRGHLIADLDPLQMRQRPMHPELDPATYGFTVWDLDREFLTDGLAGRDSMTLGEALQILRDAYCRTIGVEYMHIQDPDQKRWIQERIEGVPTRLDQEEQREILERLNAAEAFERFLHTRYVGQKRFGLEGAESAIVLLWAILDEAASMGLSEAVLGMAHRGRLNVLANIVGKSYSEIFKEFEGDLDPSTVQGSGDVKYHKGASGKFISRSGAVLPVTLASNPSHLEAVDPVVEGMARARQDLLPDPGAFPVLTVLVHGDAAFAGQGVVAETLNLSALRGYRTGGTVHLVINNQLGFTTAPEEARSSVYPTDVAKMVQAPIFHVNGDDPEACARVGRLAVAFRQAFHKDVVIDMVCYRRFGHNETDEPSYTQPQMYERIQRKRSVRKLYTEALVHRGDLSMEEAEKALQDFSGKLQTALEETRLAGSAAPKTLPPPPPPASPLPRIDTTAPRNMLDGLAELLHHAPEGFNVHPKLQKQLEERAKEYSRGEVDWALGEAFAFGSLLLEGTDVRLAGQDSRRGTFSQRHAALVDYRTGEEWVPLAELAKTPLARLARSKPGRFFIYDSLLSEYAALGFEYGYSVMRPDALVAWEAQFGDFANGAQIIIDEFIVSAADKWDQSSNLVLLLPHGYEGQGPDHSSARIERFLTLAAGNNLAAFQPTTAAQYFHLLRHQVHASPNRPLVIFTPKYLLRAKPARSRIEEFTSGRLCGVLGEPALPLPNEAVRRVILCSGKIAYEAMDTRNRLIQEAEEAGAAAVVRVEQLYPWPWDELDAELAKYPNATEVIWLQDEPENMGPWPYVRAILPECLGDGQRFWHVSRAASGSPATGSSALSQLESADLMKRAFAPR